MSAAAIVLALVALVLGAGPATAAEVRVLSAGAMKAMVTELGIAEAVKPKTVLWKGGYAAEALVNGQAELCVHQISEIIPVKGVTLVGPLPAEINRVTTYAGALVASGPSPDAGRAFLAYLGRPEFRPKFAAAGLDEK
jgi:molybdate transport system substrate-binding protein